MQEDFRFSLIYFLACDDPPNARAQPGGFREYIP